MLTYRYGDIFSEDTILHTCNCQLVWGAGFAAQLRKRYPEIYEMHQFFLEAQPGDIQIISPHPEVVSLFTSSRYGKYIDPMTSILAATEIALNTYAKTLNPKVRKIIASPKINSGYFGVPWEHTEKIIKNFVRNNNVDWRVYIQKPTVMSYGEL